MTKQKYKKVSTEELCRAFRRAIGSGKELAQNRKSQVMSSGHSAVLVLDDGGVDVEFHYSDIKGKNLIRMLSKCTRFNSTKKVDEFCILLEEGVYRLIHTVPGYSNDLAIYDPKTDTATFFKGVGPRRQNRALANLRLLEERFEALRIVE